ncbi:importin subunit beta-1 [Kwoniella mangroviensis CBS 10435]|uniref:Importin-95 n=1 Tax=Kwoniella mangroviensis CBS 10435 TaxID=1331196 RepID=A0A1B9IUC9_9TREE|nr:importin subunit beta-1 [Kwoniella mangroviensis CBS 10435]
MNAAQLLQDSLSPNQAARESATQQLETAARDNFHGYLHTLAVELANESQDLNVRYAAGLAFKNAIAARDAINQPQLTERWLALPDTATAPLKQSVLSTLGSPQHRAGAVAATCVSAIAAIELPVNKWPELIPQLLEFVGNQENQGLRVATLQAVGFICEVIDPEILSARSNEILTAVVQGARKEEPSHEVQHAAIQALLNSLEFIRDNFEREGERNYIMQVVCEATQSPAVTVQVGAFECLVRIMHLYYEKMDFYMERALFGLTIMGMKHHEEPVALQAIEFWSTVCEEEIDLAQAAMEAYEEGEQPLYVSKGFAKAALPDILPVLLELLCQQNEDDDEDDWTKAMAAGCCLELLANNVGNDIVQPVVPFVEAGITQSDWQRREAAVMAFGSILDGPDPEVLAPLVTQALGALIGMMQSDPSLQVRDTVAWTLSKICENMLQVIDPAVHLRNLITALVIGLNASPRTCNSCCAALNSLVVQISGDADLLGDDVQTSPMSEYYSGILKELMPIAERPTNHANSRSAAYQTISVFLGSSANDTLPVVQEVAVAMLARQEALLGLQNQLVGMDDRNNWNDMQINLCVVIQSFIRRSPSMAAPFADRIMTNLLGLIQASGKHAGVLEDAFATVGGLASALEAGFVKYMDAFSPFLFSALGSFEDWQVAQAAVYVGSDIARAINEALTPYAERLMVALIDLLRSPVVQRQVKPNAITTIGEVALAIGGGFRPYLDTTMTILSQAGSTSAAPGDEAMIDFVQTMRESIVDAFIGIMNGIKDSDASAMQPYVSGIMGFLKTCWLDEDRSDSFSTASLGLIGDFAEAYKGSIRDELLQDWVSQAVTWGRTRSGNKRAKTNAAYAQQVSDHSPRKITER